MIRTLNPLKDYEIYSRYNMQDGEVCGVKMPALTWRRKKRKERKIEK